MCKAIYEGLLIFSEGTRNAICSYLERNHHIKVEEVPDRLETFHEALRSLFGSGTKVVEKAIAKILHAKLGLSFEEHDDWTLIDYVKNVKKLMRDG